jgi:hypothetical protein
VCSALLSVMSCLPIFGREYIPGGRLAHRRLWPGALAMGDTEAVRRILYSHRSARPGSSEARAWVFWQPDRLVFAFTWTRSPTAASKWAPAALCMITGRASIVVLTMPGPWVSQQTITSTSKGYRVEATIPRTALAEFGLECEPDARWRAGLFRADFRPANRRTRPGSPG